MTRMSNGAAPSPAQQQQQQQQAPSQGRSAPPAFSSKLEQRWGRGEVAMEAGEPLPAEEEEFVEPSPQMKLRAIAEEKQRRKAEAEVLMALSEEEKYLTR